MCLLLELPTELLNHVFAHLDIAPPSRRHFDSLPTFHRSSQAEQILKNISLVSHRFRKVVLHRLFTHLRVDAGSVKRLLQFINQADISLKVESIVVEVLSRTYVSGEPLWWCQLLDQVPASRIIVHCEPEAYNVLFNLQVNLNDSWAFKVHCQYIEFRQPQDLSHRTIPCDAETGLFAAKSWQALRINEGSSLAAYTSYEYFLKKHPSLLASLEQYLSVSPQVLHELAGYEHALAGSSSMLIATAGMFENLHTFSYTAIFPFYNHVDEIMKCVRRMKNLRCLFVKLCPDAGSTILEDAVHDAKGHIDLNDPWSEYVFTGLHRASSNRNYRAHSDLFS